MGLRFTMLAAAGSAAILALGAQPVAAKDLAIHAGRLIDGTGKAVQTQVTILVHDDRITGVQPGFTAPKGAEVVDLANSTVLPGLIDDHVHITQSFHKGDPIHTAMTRTDFDDEIDATVNARATLMAGFTSARDVGGATGVVVALKRAINAGVIPGPRLWVAGTPLGPTGGHGDAADGLDPELSHPGWTDNLIDSPEAARRTVRKLRREGVDLIKIMPSGGVMSIGDDPTLQLMTDDEIKAVIETAHSLGMKVAAHAHGKQAIDHTLELGVDSIEHGTYADAESYKLFKAHGAYFVPTMLVGSKVVEHAKNHPEPLHGPKGADRGALHAQQHAQRLCGGREDRLRHRHLRHVQPRGERPGIQAPGQRRHAAHGGDQGRCLERRRPDRRHQGHRLHPGRPLRRHHRRRRRSAEGRDRA